MQLTFTHHGYQILRDPHLNKGNAFTSDERIDFGLRGLLPNVVETIDTQIQRVEEQVDQFDKPINKYIYLTQLQDNNQTLFFRTVMKDPAKYFPIVYTPTVGEACEKFGHILRRPRGLYISIADRGQIRDLIRNWPEADVRFAVVSDGERILGLGDLGVCGMGIPIGKLTLYTACAGIHPNQTLPIMLDVGTNNEVFLKDPLYLGLKTPRVRGKEYDDFLEEFVYAMTEAFPKVCIQWEDFAGPNAVSILAKYRDRICTFNDDIQGTAGVAVAGLLAACKYNGRPMTEQRFLFFGAGSAATGISGLLTIMLQEHGLSYEEAKKHCWLFNSGGLVVASRKNLDDYKMVYAHEHPEITDFVEAIETLKPTAIIGASTIGGAFTKEVIEAVARINERPIIFPLSNPNSHSECTAEDAFTLTNGRVLFASGSPFNPVTVGGSTYFPSQGNNVYIFPAVGLAILATEPEHVSDQMFLWAARALASQVTEEMVTRGIIYPPISEIRAVATEIAIDVATRIFDGGLATVDRPADIAKFVKSKMYYPEY
ncbi:MAG: NAD-dependent malic enzyme [Bacteroidota bacterium]|nr:NAD-dependent malic enzyme [Bacteroidota bacterium]MDP4230832.1 NAD-dependent malic enzyme [Bacteroidota bacterium]MDP4237419.1 NAD-dependent malic enzyme [Bacteroidota bacterium]